MPPKTTDTIANIDESIADINTQVESMNRGGQRNLPQLSPISPEDIAEPETDMDLPESEPESDVSGELAGMETMPDTQDQFIQELGQETEQAQRTQDTSLDAYLNTLLSEPGETEATITAYEEAGVNERKRELLDINDQMRREQLSARRRIERAKENMEGRSATAIQNEVRRIENESYQKQADLAVIQMARQGRYDSAKEIADRAVAVQMEQQQRVLAARELIYQNNKDAFTRAEQREFETKQADRQRRLEREERSRQLLEAEKMRYVQNAAQFGASNSVLSTIQSARSFNDLYGISGVQNYALSPAEKLDQQIKNRQYQLLGIDIQTANDARVAAQEAQEQGLLTEDQYAQANELRSEWNSKQEVKDAKSLEGDTASLLASLNQETGVGDIAAINSFQRLVVDPGVAVREGDVALLQSAQSWTDEAALAARGLLVGDKLTDKARQQMRDVVKDVYSLRVDLVEENTAQIRTVAEERNIDFGKYVGKEFLDFETINGRVKGQTDVNWGVNTGTNYADNVIESMSASGANPYGIELDI